VKLEEEIVNKVLTYRHLNEILRVVFNAGEIGIICLVIFVDGTLKRDTKRQFQESSLLSPW
jgi:hypothetical protein